MDASKRELLSHIAAFRGVMTYDALEALTQHTTGVDLDSTLDELIDRGLLLYDRSQAHYDLHPIVRQYAYERLTARSTVHTRLRDYFAKVPIPSQRRIKTVDQLSPVIELYHHTVRAGQYDEALDLLCSRLHDQLYYRFGAYEIVVELLRGLFPDGDDRIARLKTADDQCWVDCALANVYARSGQVGGALPLYLRAKATDYKMGAKVDVCVELCEIAYAQLAMGHLREAEQSLQKEIELSQEIHDTVALADGRHALGRLRAYQGRSSESGAELKAALTIYQGCNDRQAEGQVWFDRSLAALIIGNMAQGIEFAREARKLADVASYERDIIQAEWLLGWAQTAQAPAAAEAHLAEVLTRCRRISLVELEPEILLSWARWHRGAGNEANARDYASESLAIAERCDYRLVQAEGRNFLAQVYLDSGDRAAALESARTARELAWCSGPPDCYIPALKEAEALIASASP